MTSTGMVSQPAIAKADPIANRPEQPGRNAVEEDDFSGLLSRLASGNQEASRGEGRPIREQARPEAEQRRAQGWLPGGPLPEGVETVADAQPPAGQIPGDADAIAQLALQAAAPAATAVSSLPAPAGAAIAAMGDATALPGAVAPPPDPATAASQPLQAERGAATAQSLPEETARATASVTVLKQETHLAPARATAAAGGAEWAAAVLDSGARPSRSARAASIEPGREAQIGSGETRQPSGGLGPGPSPVAVVGPLRGTQASAVARQGVPPADPSPAPAAIVVEGEVMRLPEPASSGVRAPPAVDGVPVSNPVQLIADRIVAEARAGKPGGAPATPAFLAPSPLLSPARVLHIELQPAELGTVTVRLSLKERSLQLDMEVGRGEVLQIIQRERETLSSMLRSAGYLVESLDVRVADPQNAGTSAGGASSGTQMQWGGQPGSSHADPRSPGARAREDARQDLFGTEGNGASEQMAEPNRRGGVYV